jgi:hypothetical protein
MSPEEIKQKINSLEDKVKTLEAKLTAFYTSGNIPEEFLRNLVRKGFFRLDKTLISNNVSGKESKYVFINYSNESSVAVMDYSERYKQFTAATSDTCTSPSHGYEDNDMVYLLSSGDLPAGLSSAIPYYIINSTSDTFKLSLTSGGAAVNITDTGAGFHYLYPY